MGDSEVFRTTLKLFRFESEVIANTASDLEWKKCDIDNSTELLQELHNSFNVASFPDQLKVSSHILTSLDRFLNRCFSSVTLKVLHLKLLLSSSNLLEQIISVLWMKDANQDKVYSVLCHKNMLVSMVLQVVTLFEVIKENLRAENNEDFIPNEEHLTLTYLKLFLNLLEVCFYQIKETLTGDKLGIKQKLLSKLQGPVLAQTIQSLLHFAKHKSKTVASYSLQCLLTLLIEISTYTKSILVEFGADDSSSAAGVMTTILKSLVADFRNFFPGIFSSLYALCSSGYKSGSNVLHLALLCIIQATALITSDDQVDNQTLIRSLTKTVRSSGGNHTKVDDFSGAVGSSKESFLNDLMSRISKTNTVTIIPESSTASPAGTKSSVDNVVNDEREFLPSNFATIEAFQQWRVDILQRIEVHLPLAYRETLKVLTPKQKVKVAQALSQLIIHSTNFLGLHGCVEYILCLLSAICDSTAMVREGTRECWHELRLHLITKQSAMFLQLQTQLNDKFVLSLKNAVKHARLLNDKTLVYELNMLLGIGYVLHKNMNVLLYSNSLSQTHSTGVDATTVPGNDDSSVLRRLLELTKPDLQAIKTIALQSRRYHAGSNTSKHFTSTSCSRINSSSGQNNSFVDGGYFRLQWKCTNDDETKSLIRRLCVLIGKYGSLQDIIKLTSTTVKDISKLRKLTSNNNNTHSKYARKLELTVDADTSPAALSGEVAAVSGNDNNQDASLAEMREAVSKAIAALRLLNYALIGQLSRALSDSGCAAPTTAKSTAVNATEPSKCQVCATEGTDSKPLNRCSRCKAVHYCCREHQLKDWSTHKLICGKMFAQSKVVPKTSAVEVAVETKVTDDASSTPSSETSLYTVNDIVDPEILLSSPQLSSYTAQTAQISLVADSDTKPSPKMPQLVIQNMESTMKLALHIIHQYLYYKSAHAAFLSTGISGSFVTGTELTKSSSSKNWSFRSGNSSYFVELVKYYSVLAASATECIANCALLLGYDHFSVYLMECLYPLLELLVDSDYLVKQAAKCSLDRMALYLCYADFADMIRQNLDYIVEEVCANLRSTTNTFNYTKKLAISMNTTSGRIVNGNKKKMLFNKVLSASVNQTVSHSNTTTHLIVDLVFSTIGNLDGSEMAVAANGNVGVDKETTTSGTASPAIAPLFLLKDVIFDTIENIDTLATSSLYNNNNSTSFGSNKKQSDQLTALLKVLQVFVYHAMKPPPLESLLLPSNKTKVVESAGDQVVLSPYFVRKIYGTSGVKSAPVTLSKLSGTPNQKGPEKQVGSLTSRDNSAAADDSDGGSIYEKIQRIAKESKFQKAASEIHDNDSNGEDGDAADEPTDDDNSTPVVKPSEQLLLDILKRCGYFISIQNSTVTISVIETISAALLRLSCNKTLLYPAIHQIFPPLMSRLQETIDALKATKSNVGTTSATGDLQQSDSGVVHDVTLYDPLTQTYTSAVNPNSTIVTVLNSSSTNSVERLYILPSLCEMFTLMAIIAGEFITLKYREEVFPDLIKILQFYHVENMPTSSSVAGAGGGGIGVDFSLSTPSKPKKSVGTGGGGKLSLDDLIISDKSTIKTKELQSVAADSSSGGGGDNVTASASVKATTGVETVNSRYSIHSKTKLAILSFLSQLSLLPQGMRLLQSHAPVFIWFMLPLMLNSEAAQVADAASKAQQNMARLDCTFIKPLLEAIVYSHPKMVTAAGGVTNINTSDAKELWATVTSNEAIVAVYNKTITEDRPISPNTSLASVVSSGCNSGCSGGFAGLGLTARTTTTKTKPKAALTSVPHADSILKHFHADSSFMKRVSALLTTVKALATVENGGIPAGECTKTEDEKKQELLRKVTKGVSQEDLDILFGGDLGLE